MSTSFDVRIEINNGCLLLIWAISQATSLNTRRFRFSWFESQYVIADNAGLWT